MKPKVGPEKKKPPPPGKATKPAEPYVKPSDPVESAAVYWNHTALGHPDYNPGEATAQATFDDANWLIPKAIGEKRRLKRNQRELSKSRAAQQTHDGNVIRDEYRKIAAGFIADSVRRIPTLILIKKVIAAAVEKGLPARKPGTVRKYLVGLKDWG